MQIRLKLTISIANALRNGEPGKYGFNSTAGAPEPLVLIDHFNAKIGCGFEL